jgi:hypothetical protein
MVRARSGCRDSGAAALEMGWSVKEFTSPPTLSDGMRARADFHNRYGTFFSPRLSALIRHAGWTSRWSIGQGFFAPTPLTEETEAAGLSRLTLPRPLIAERGRSASVDLTRSVGPLSITGTLFASNIDHPVYVNRDAEYSLINLAAPRKNRGAELLATWRKAPFAATFSYSYVRASELDPGGRSEGIGRIAAQIVSQVVDILQLEKHVAGHGFTQVLLQAVEQDGRLQRITTKLKKIVVDTDAFDMKNIRPRRHQGCFQFRAWRHKWCVQLRPSANFH